MPGEEKTTPTRDDIRDALGLPKSAVVTDPAAKSASDAATATPGSALTAPAPAAPAVPVVAPPVEPAKAGEVDAMSILAGDVPDDVANPEPPGSAVPAETEIPEPEGMNPKQAEAFKVMRQQIETLRAQVKTTPTPANTQELESLRKELEGMRQKVAAVDLREDPIFKSKFDRPINATYAEAVTMLKEFGADPTVAEKAVRMPMKTRKEFLTEEVPTIAPELSLLFSRIDMVNRQRQEAIKNFEQTQRSLAQEREQVEASRLGSAFETAANSLRADKHFLLAPSKDENWNKGVQRRLDVAKSFLKNAQDPTHAAQVALRAALSDDYRALYLKTRQDLVTLQEQTGRRVKAAPKIGAGTDTTGSGSKVERKARSGEEVGEIMASRLGQKRS